MVMRQRSDGGRPATYNGGVLTPRTILYPGRGIHGASRRTAVAPPRAKEELQLTGCNVGRTGASSTSCSVVCGVPPSGWGQVNMPTPHALVLQRSLSLSLSLKMNHFD
jgi:hypothetical protein